MTQELSELPQTHRGCATKALHKMLIFLTEHATDHADIARLFERDVMAHPVALADALKENTTLISLDLYGNNISETSEEHIKAAWTDRKGKLLF